MARFAPLALAAAAAALGVALAGATTRAASAEPTTKALSTPSSTLRAPLAPIEAAFAAEERAKYVELPVVPNAVPVLLFHQICEVVCRPEEDYAMTRLELAKTLAMLERAGYTTITIEQYARFVRGYGEGLPARPILITFDDSRLDAWLGAQEILAQAQAHATMYVITARAEGEDAGYMRWSEIEAAAASGVWDMQLHAHAGHTTMQVGFTTDGAPVMKHAYAWRLWSNDAFGEGETTRTSGSLEDFDDWRGRVTADLDHGDRLLAAHVPGYRSRTFAVPYSDYGQVSTNDRRITPALRELFDERFEVWFSQPGPDPEFTTPGLHREKSRFVVYRTTTAEEIYLWLALHSTQR